MLMNKARDVHIMLMNKVRGYLLDVHGSKVGKGADGGI